jgi:hypothetical protein
MEGNKKANRISHRYNRLPLLPSRPGGVRQELVVSICRGKVTQKMIACKNIMTQDGILLTIINFQPDMCLTFKAIKEL